MSDAVRTLYVCDTDDPACPSRAELQRADRALAVTVAHGVGDALDCLATETFDCVLTVYQLPDEDGITLLRNVRDFDPDLPFVLYTHRGSERIASEAISAGVTDYIRNDPDLNQTETVTDHIREAVSETSNDFESRIRELTEATDDVLWLLSADWEEVLFVNSAYSTIWGQPESKLRADPTAFLDAVHPDDRARAREAVNRLTDGEAVEIELRINPTEDFQRRVLIQAEPIFDRDGTVKRFAGASRDVTEQRARRRRLEEEQQMVDSIFSALPDVLYTFDTQGYLLRWNEQLEAETGYTSSEIEDMYVTDFVPTDEIERIATSFQAIINDRRQVTVESAFETKGGERVPFEFTGGPLVDPEGDLRGVTGIGRNISDRKERQRRFEAVFNNTYQFTGLMSPDGTLLEVNQTAIEFSGRHRDALVGEQIWDAYWFQANETAQQIAKRAVETAREGEFFREQITVQGSSREAVIDFSVRPVTDEDGTVELLIPEGRDITRLSEREQQLDVTNRFLRHNIRNKLTAIQGYAELVTERGDGQLESYGSSILRSATDLDATAEMARNIHDLIEVGPTSKVVDVVKQIDRAVTTTHDRYPDADITVSTPESFEVLSLRSLESALAELLTILLSNASDDKPTVRIDIREGDTAVLHVRMDTGNLPAAERAVLTGDIDIDQFRHAEGLGVWYVYWHVWYSGGKIRVTDDEPHVRIHLPTP